MDLTSKLVSQFTLAYNQYADALFRYCYFKTSDRELAKDLVQQTFLQAWNYLQAGQKIKDFKPFLYRIAGNLVIDWYRKRKEESLDSLASGGLQLADNRQDPIDQAEIALVLKTLDKLDVGDKELIIWRHIEGLSIKEISAIISETENTVSVRLHRALQKLRDLLN